MVQLLVLTGSSIAQYPLIMHKMRSVHSQIILVFLVFEIVEVLNPLPASILIKASFHGYHAHLH